VVNGGEMKREKGMSSKPTTEIFRNTMSILQQGWDDSGYGIIASTLGVELPAI